MAGDSSQVTEVAVAAEEPLEAADFDSVYDALFPFVWRTARRMGVHDPSLDDVCQEVFVVVHRRLGEFRGTSSLKTWVFGVLMNVIQVHRRTQQRKSTSHPARDAGVDPDSLSDDASARPDQRAADREAARAAHTLLAELPDDQRTVFILAELEEMPVTEIALAVGANLNTVYARLRAARKTFEGAARRYRAKDLWRLG